MDYEKVIESIEKQIREYVGDKKAIIGLSGGIDSTVIAYLCVRALGKENVIGISMPCNDEKDVDLNVSSLKSTDDAWGVAVELDIECLIRNIAPIVNEFYNMEQRNITDLTLGNIMARVRMTTLYMYANEYKGLVIGTTNKTEAEIGYYTKYGDGAVDIEPIADLYKTEVWEVAKIIGVPQKIIDKKPSAELWEGHSDEDDFGMTYEEMDEMLQIEPMSINIWKDKFGEKGIKLLDMVEKSDHKKHMPPFFKVR